MEKKLTGYVMARMIWRGMDELTDKNLQRLVNYMRTLLDEQEAGR